MKVIYKYEYDGKEYEDLAFTHGSMILSNKKYDYEVVGYETINFDITHIEN